MHNQEQIEAARVEFNRIWNETLWLQFQNILDDYDTENIYNACWQSFLHGLRWVALPTNSDSQVQSAPK